MRKLTSVIVASVLGLMLSSMGCEVSHTETHKEGLFGGHKHEETTVTKNPVTGERSVEHSETRTNP